MRSSNKIKSIVFNLLTIVSICLIFFVSSMLLKTQKNPLYNYIPNKYEFYGELNNQLINKNIANEVLLNSPNDSLYLQFSNYITQIKTDPTKKTGLNLFSNIVFFKAKIKNTNVLALLFDLNDSKQFNNLKFPQFIYHTSNNQLGIALISLDKVNLSKSEFHELASLILKNQNTKLKIRPLNKDEIFKISYKDNKHQLSVLKKNNGMSIIGELKFNDTEIMEQLFRNKFKSNIHITANQLPNFISIFLQEKLNQQLHNTPAIKGLSVNYQGLEIKESQDDDFSIIPNINAHFQFDTIITQKRLITIFEAIKSISVDTLTNSLLIGDQKFEYYINNNHLYFGENQSSFKTHFSQTMFQFRGTHASIFNIKGPSFITGFIDMLPPYFILKNYAKNIHTLEFMVKKNKSNSALLVKGILKMKADKNLYHETLKMILDFQSSGL